MSVWIPRGVSWLRTIILFLITSATVGSLRIFSTYGEYFTYATRHLGFFLFMSLMGLFLPFIGYAYIHCWLLGNKPKGWAKKIPSPSSIKESLLSFVVLIFGFIATLLTVVIPFTTGYLTNSDIERITSIASFTWLVITIYMFHAFDLITRPYQQKTDKSKPETPKSKIDPIDRELNHLKHKTGIHFKDTPKN